MGVLDFYMKFLVFLSVYEKILKISLQNDSFLRKIVHFTSDFLVVEGDSNFFVEETQRVLFLSFLIVLH